MLTKEALAQGKTPFETRTDSVKPEDVERLLNQGRWTKVLIDALSKRHWPTDEKTCDQIGIKVGLIAEQVAAVSRHCHAVKAEKDSGEASIH